MSALRFTTSNSYFYYFYFSDFDWWWTKNPFLPAEASLEEEEAEKGKPPRPIFLISLAIDTGKPGQEYPANPHGMCAFYDPEKQRCTIHPVKPFECREYMHYDTERDVRLRQKEAGSYME